ncbi:MAG: hypothetical protein NT075_31530 [Chloroflexi bacterium]|nr:hypothetical protein [Chloroflexota bacterium]
MPQKHSRKTSNGRYFGLTERLWQLASDLPIKSVPLSAIAEFDQNCWFSATTPPTCRTVATHAKRIYEADLAYPIILSAQGYLMDGGHRLAKAWLMGLTEIRAVQFAEDPAPDYIVVE